SQVLVVILATAAAQVFRATFRGKRTARFVLLLPWAVPVSLAAIAWTWIFDSTFSVINWTLKAAGLLHGWLYWLGEPGLALVAIIIVQAWRIFPFATVIVLAGLASLPQDVMEAAIVDGAGFWRRLFYVELPLLLPVLLDRDHRVQAEPRPLRRRVRHAARAVDLQRPANAGTRAPALRTDGLPALDPKLPDRGRGRRRHHGGGGGTGRIQPGPAH